MNPIEQPLDAREARNSALEEAARVCMRTAKEYARIDSLCSPLATQAALESGSRIRALKSQEPSRLFAAAPALLEALEAAVTQLEIVLPEHFRIHDERAALAKARAAIAAAKGE